MKRLLKSLMILLILTGTGILLVSCNLALLPGAGRSDKTATVVLRLMIPDYANHRLPEEPPPPIPRSKGLAIDAVPKIVAPNTETCVVTISAQDISPDIVKAFSFSENGGWYEGDAWIDCEIQDVPIGTNRRIQVETLDATGNLLTQGEVMVNIDANVSNSFRLPLKPVSPTPLSLNVVRSESVEHGGMKFYSLDLSAMSGNLCLVTLESLLYDLDLYSYTSEGFPDEMDCWEPDAPTAERLMLDTTHTAFDKFYLGVFANSPGGPNPFALLAKPYTGTDFPSNFIQAAATGSFSSIAGSGTAAFQDEQQWSEELDGNAEEEVTIGFPFEYNGVQYETLYVCSHGYITFWPYKSNWLWDQWGFGQPALPNNLIAVYLASLNIDFNAGQGVYYQTAGTAPNRTFTVEYQYLEKWGPNPVTWNWEQTGNLTAQIILHENGNAIELLYDRGVAPGSDGAVGLENDDGQDTRGPGVVTDLPASDLRFEYQ